MHGKCVRMTERDEIVGHAVCQRDHLIDLQISENAMMRCFALLAEQAEENEHVAPPHPLIGKMGLRRADLPENAGAVVEKHRIVMA
jgi:hypothetical protein